MGDNAWQAALVVSLVALIIPARCAVSTSETSRARATSTLEADGYTDVEADGFRMWTCGEGGLRSTGFTATSPNGTEVTGAVCCGLVMRACSIRVDPVD